MGKAIRLSSKAASQTGLRARRKKIVRALIGESQAQHYPVAEPSEADIRWAQDILILRKAAEELATRRYGGITRSVQDSNFRNTAVLLSDPSAETRRFAVRTLYDLDPDQAATLVNNALRDGSREERRNIGAALSDSGLLFEAIDDLMNEWMTALDKHRAMAESWFATNEQDQMKLREFRHQLPVLMNEWFARYEQRKVSTDMAVPDEAFPDMFQLYQQTLRESGLRYTIFGHIGDNHERGHKREGVQIDQWLHRKRQE